MAVKGSSVRVAAHFDRLRDRLSSLDPRAEAMLLAAACVLLAGALILPLVLPGRTLSFIYANDIMIFFDGAHRVISGQLPNRDFHTPLGLLAYLLPALGLWLGGSLGGMMPLATAAMTFIFLPILIYVCASRLPLAHGLIFAFFALALVVSPANIGETLPSFAMFYNRWGYALLAALFLLVLPPLRGKPRPWVDAIVAAAILLATFYLKISYFGVAIGFTFVLLLYRDRRLLAIKALILTAGGIALIHLLWGGTASYFSDIATAARVNGAVRASPLGLFRMGIENAAMILPFLMVMGLAVRRGIATETLVLSTVMAVAGLALYNQNFQGPGIMTLVPAAIILAVALSWPREDRSESKNPSAFAALLLVAVLALPPAILSAESVLLHSLFAMRGGDSREYVAEVDGFLAQEISRPPDGEPGFELTREAYRTGEIDLRVLKLLRMQALRQVLAQPEYLWTVQDGARLLRTDPRLSGTILTLDMANPFNALTGRRAPSGVESWYHAGRSFNETTYPDPGELFADVDIVMVPKAPVQPPSHLLLSRLYGGHIARHYELVATSDYWFAYKRRQQAESS